MKVSERRPRNDIYLTVILPVFQEARTIRNSLNSLYKITTEFDYPVEIIVADDGSTDRCDRIVSDLMNDIRNLRLVRHPVNMGRGFILMKAIRQSSGNIICYVDADLQVDPKAIPSLIDSIKAGAHIAIGSKHHPTSLICYSKWRKIQSFMYNWLARRILGVNIRDFQCGMKAFTRSCILDLAQHLTCKKWSWDTELIFKAIVLGYTVVEIPVIVRSNRDRRSFVKMGAGFSMALYLLRLWIWSKTQTDGLTKPVSTGELGLE